MKKPTGYIDQCVEDAIGVHYDECKERPENRAECRYRIVVLTVLSFLYSVVRRISTLLFFCFGIFAGVLFSLLLKALAALLLGG